MKIELQSVYSVDDYEALLFRLLLERPKEANISHKKIPTWKGHKSFVASQPYEAWYFIINDEHIPVGSVYLTNNNEIGVFVFKNYQRFGYAAAAINELIKQHGPKAYLANIAPLNEASRKLFEKLGFNLCQHTYRLIIS